MKDIKELLFNYALFYADRARELKKELGEWDTLVTLNEARYNAILTVIEESGLYAEWIVFLKNVLEQREQFKKQEEAK